MNKSAKAVSPAPMFVDTLGDYRSAASGNWNAVATWERFDGVNWVAAVATPTSADGVITIRSPHTVTISASGLSYDQVVVDSGGQVTVAATITSTLANGTGTDLVINGTWLNQGGTWTTTGTWQVNSGGTYIHNTTSGVATPLGQATLDAASNFIYRGSSTLTPALSTSGRTYGNLSFESTSGTYSLGPNGAGTLTVNGDFTIGSGVTLTITQTGTMTFAGNFTNNGTLTNSTGTQVYTFTGSSKTISGTGAISFETFNVNNGASITASSAVTEAATFTGTVTGTLATAATFTNSGTVNVNGTFQVNQGGSAAGTALVYGANSTLSYNGTSSQTTTNIEFPAASGPPNVTINNAGGVTLHAARTVGGTLTLTNGAFSNGANLIVGNGSTISRATGSLGSVPTFGTNVNVTYTGSSGVTTGNEIPASSTVLNTLTVNNTGGVTLGSNATFNGASSIGSGATLNTGAFTFTVGNILTNSGTLNVNSGGAIKGTGTVSGPVNVQSGGAIAPGNSAGILNTGNVGLTSGSAFNVEIGGTTAGTQYDQLNVTGAVTLGNATLNLSSLSFTPSGGQSFTIVNNDNNDAVSGTFNGLAEGATISNFLGSGLNATITYAGGSNNNDVVITVQAPTLKYRSKTSGNWNDFNTWQVDSGSGFVDAVSGQTPTSADDTITIRSPDTVSVSASVSGDQLTVDSGGTLRVNSSVTLTNATTTINGTLELRGAITSAPTYGSSSTLVYDGPSSRGAEWTPGVTSGAGYPHHVTINSGTLDIGTGVTQVLQIGGDLANFSTLTLGNMTQPLRIMGTGTQLNSGTMTLSSASGGDLEIAGVGAGFQGGNGFNSNGRALKFTDASSHVFIPGNLGVYTDIVASVGSSVIQNTTNLQLNGSLLMNGPGYNSSGLEVTFNGNNNTQLITGSSIAITTLHINHTGTGTVDATGVTAGNLAIGTLNLIAGTFVANTLQVTNLNGSGTITSPITIASGGTVAPGSSPGILNTGDITFTSGSTYAVEYAGTTAGTGYDQLNVTGTVTLGGATLTNTALSFTPSAGNAFTIINNDSNDAVSGTFAGLIEGATISNFLGSGLNGTITYVGGDGNDVVITVNSPAASDTDVVLSGGNLIVTDANGGNTDDTLFLSLVSGNVRITDPNHSLNCGAGMTTVNANTCDVSFSSVTGNIQVDTQGGNDALTLELAGGDFIPSGGVSYAGGTQTTSDKLFITGGSQGLVSYNYTNANDGNIVMQNFGTVTYTGLEPISNSGSGTDVIFNLPGGVANSATLTDLGGGMTRLASLGTFEQTDFANPSGSITINGGTLNDLFDVGPLANVYPSLTVNGNEGNDTVDLVGNVTFAANASLDLNLQDDDPTPGIDSVFIDAQAITSGTGTIDIRVSQDVIANSAGRLQTQNGNLTIEANQQPTLTTGENNGVEINGATVESTGTGNISIKGRGGEGVFDVMYGVLVWNGGKVLSSGTGTIAVEGTGGNRTGGAASNDALYGVHVYLLGSEISSISGGITITGNGGATNDTGSYGVVVAGGKVETSGAGTLTINGNGGTVTGGSGVFVDSAGIFVVADDVNGDGGVVRSTGTGVNAGSIIMTGISGSAGTGAGQGLRVDTPGTVTTVDGSITLSGTGGACGNACLGTSIRGAVTATGTGSIALNGTGATSTGAFPTHGVNVRTGGNVTVKNGNLTVTGTGGNGTDNADFNLAPTGIGTLQVAAGGTGSITINANTIVIRPAPNVSATINAGTSAVNLRQRTNGVAINLGSTVDTTPSTVELSDAELDRVTAAGTLNIGDNNSGPITVSNNITRPASTNMTLTTSGDITISSGQVNTGGGTLLLDSGLSPAGVKPTKSGTDVTASTLSFGSDLDIVINGTTVDTQYTQLNVVGGVNLNNLDLKLSGTHSPTPGDTFIVVNNDAADAIVGTFTGLPQGATISNFLGSPYSATVSYTGGDGNDAQITVVAGCVAPSTVYVDDSWIGTTPGTDPDGGAGPATNFGCDSFATIQDGINGVTAGGTVIVYAGTYAENVLVNKPVSLLGPNAGIDPNTGTRVGEAVVVPAVVETSLQASTSGTVFRVGNGSGHINATINGFTIDGHNAALTGGRTLNGVEVHTGAAVVNSTGSFDTTPNAFDTTMVVTNNIIQNLERYGVLVDNTSARNAVTGNDVSHNKIDNLPSGNNFGGSRGRGIAFEENVYGTASYNVMTRVNVGWQDDNYDKASPGAATLVSHNTISAYSRGIFHNLQYTNASNATISDNSVSVETTGDFPASSTNIGIEVASIQNGVGATVTNNNSTNNVYGILLWNLTTTVDITITGGTLTGNQHGVYATSNEPQFGAAAATPSHSIISGVTITNPTVAGIGIDDGTNVATTALGITGGTSVTGGPLGLLMNGPGARVYNGSLNNTSLSGTANYIALTNGASAALEINATGVSFDGLIGAAATLAQNYAIEDKILHAIDDGTVGFVRVKAGNVFVTPNGFTPSTLTPNIQRGVNAAVAGDLLHAQAGLYPNIVNVTKAMSLEGANAGIAGAGVRGPESIIRTNGNQTAVVSVTGASNVTLDGFLIDGDDPAVTGVLLFSGDDTNASYAVRSTGTVNNLTITNNIASKASIGLRGDGAGQGNVVSNNWFDSIGNFDFGYSVSIRTNFYADVTNNLMTRTWTGVHINGHNGPGGPATFTISGNEIHSYAGGILYWFQFNGATGATINNNQMTAASGAVANNFGVLMVAIQNAVSPTFTNNTIDGHNYGVGLFNVPTTNTITIGPTNSITNSSLAGVFLTDNLNFDPIGTMNFLSGGPGAASTVNVTGASVTGNTGDGLKVEGQTNAQNLVANGNTITGSSGTNGAEIIGGAGSANLTGNNITGFATGLAFVNNTGATQTMTGSFNRIISGTNAFTATGSGTFNNTVENNWWGCNAGPGNAGCGAASGTGIDFNPWIVLQVSATPTTPGGNSTVTADMTHNSNNVVPAGVTALPLPTVAFSATGGTIAPPTNTFTSGQSQATFTSTSSSNGSACATVDNQQTCATVNVTAPSFSIDDVPHNEGNASTTSYTFTVTKTGTTAFSSSVQFQTADNTATLSDNDYQSNSGTLTFGPTDTTMQVTVLVNGDTKYEANDTFFVNLLGPVDATISDGQGLGTITNDDTAPTLSINDRTLLEGTTPGTTNFTFTVTKTGLTGVSASVNFATANGTTNPATGGASCGAGIDYISQSGTLTFPATGPGSTTQTITVPVCREAVYEANETFFVNLSGEVDATVTDNQGLGTITNDDSPGPSVTVNSTNDVDDGICNAAHCSLREAINAANIGATPVAINFAIPASDSRHFYYKDDGVASQVTNDLTHVLPTTAANDAALPADKDPDWPHGWWSILPTSQLPTLTQNSLVDGYTQAEATVNTASTGTNAVLKIEIQGSSAGTLPPVTGLMVTNGSSSVRGLVVNRFSGHGLDINCNVNGNFLGTDVSGTLDVGNALSGVAVGNNMVLGGVTPALVNLISGNDTDGVLINNGNSNTIQGNLIGTKANGTVALPNTGNGINLSGGGSVFNSIGGVNPGEGNTIAFNTGDGVQLSNAGTGNSIRGNSISSNGSTNLHLGIDLDGDGVTANDSLDSDPGPNNLQNFPSISALVTGSTKTISGTLNSTPGQTFTIDFYANAACDASGNGEGATYLGSTTTTATDGSGNVSFTFHPASLTVGQVITATATSATGDTSEFSPCATVTTGTAGNIQFVSATYNVNENTGPAHITFQRVGGTDGSISASFSTIPGGTASGSDYTSVTQTVTFADGDTAIKTVDVPITDDPTFEGNETVNLCLGGTIINVVGCTGGTATLTIIDNDVLNMSARDARVAEPTSGSRQMIFAVSLDSAAAIPVSVNYATANDTGGANPAIGGATCNGTTDYQPTSGTLNFAAGERIKTVAVNVCSDTVSPENDETLLLNLSGNAPAGTNLARAQAVGTITQVNAPGAFLISELRTSGPGGLGDDYVELYNNTDTPLTVNASDATAGYGLFKMGTDCNTTPVLIGTIPNGTVIPARGHYLFVGSQYSLTNYGGAGASAGDQTLTQDIESDRNVGIFSTTDINKLATVTRLDAVGFDGNTGGGVCDLLREGTTLPPVSGSTTEHSFFRKECDFVSGLGCTTPGTPKDTNNNSDDLMFADTQGTFISGVPQRLGAPGPENLGAPLFRAATVNVTLIDNTKAQSVSPNRVRDLTPNPGNNSSFGTISVRRRVVNNTGANVTRLRFRIVELTTFPSPGSGTADLRALTIAGPVMVSGINDPGTCGVNPIPCTVPVQGTTLESPPAQPNGGGLNSTVSAGTVSTGAPLLPGQSINVNFLLGVQTTGNFRFLIIVEALP